MIDTRKLYESMTTEQLHELRAAFASDRSRHAETVAFCEQRLTMIASVLAQRSGELTTGANRFEAPGRDR